jgi:hypothetical protein
LRAYKNQARLKEKSGISSRSLADEKVCDRWRKRENATLKKLETLASGLAIIALLASLVDRWQYKDPQRALSKLEFAGRLTPDRAVKHVS